MLYRTELTKNNFSHTHYKGNQYPRTSGVAKEAAEKVRQSAKKSPQALQRKPIFNG
jgi:hypothetical protein